MTPVDQLLPPVSTRTLTSGVRLSWARFHEEPSPGGEALLAANRLGSATKKRQAEFLAGRVLTCEAFGIADLPRGGAGAPLWPAGITGALSHSKGCIAALAGPDTRRLGLDLEALLPEPSLGPLIARALTSAERRRLLGMPPPQQARRMTLIFSAKETVYKALAGEAGGGLEFQAVCLIGCSDGLRGRWIMQLTRRVASGLPEGGCLKGWFVWHDNMVLTCLDMPGGPLTPQPPAPESAP
ncbi:phosphopantetheinyltransferase component of enterobactin synthase multienzyme complex [Pseudovibrio sp. WM33]|nr:phosphopantetheinyltransferase component of enterobactin synthase multienzyme complex [Pseudovibrio sp. WM33]